MDEIKVGDSTCRLQTYLDFVLYFVREDLTKLKVEVAKTRPDILVVKQLTDWVLGEVTTADRLIHLALERGIRVDEETLRQVRAWKETMSSRVTQLASQGFGALIQELCEGISGMDDPRWDHIVQLYMVFVGPSSDMPKKLFDLKELALKNGTSKEVDGLRAKVLGRPNINLN